MQTLVRLLCLVANHQTKFFFCFFFLFQQVLLAQDPNFHIYLCFGQSNMAGAGDIEAQDRTVDSRFQFMKPQDCASKSQFAGNWYPAVPPLWGCTGGIGPADYFGRTMVANLPTNVKVGVVVVAVPGCKIELFGKTGYQGLDTYNNVPSKYGGSAYAWLLDLAKQAQKTGVIKGILLHQGESNLNDQAWPTKVKSVYDNLIQDLSLEAAKTPLLAGELLYQNYGSCCSAQNPIIAKLPSVLPNSYVISASGLPGKDVYHFNSAGVRTFGQRYAEKMLSLIPKGTAPAVSLTSPANNSSYSTLQIVTLSADATDTDGSISKVEFYDGSTLLGSDNSFPYTYSWSGISPGTHSLTAKATDNTGSVGTSNVITITVQGLQSPFKGTPFSIPGRIEAEDYDLGGEGVAYQEMDENGNQGGATLRNDQVDIENTTDQSGAYNIAYVLQGEWLEYTVDVSETEMYRIEMRVAADGDGKSLHVEVDGQNVSGVINVPNTGGWQKWLTVTTDYLNLRQGQHIVRLVFDASYLNLNYIEFKQAVRPRIEDKALEHAPFFVNPFGEEGLRIIQNGDFTYRISDIHGSLLEQGRCQEGSLIGKSLAKGVFFLSLEQGQLSSTHKIMKQ